MVSLIASGPVVEWSILATISQMLSVGSPRPAKKTYCEQLESCIVQPLCSRANDMPFGDVRD